MNRHHVTNLAFMDGERIFSDAGWERIISPKIDAMPCKGGCICIFLDAAPEVQNFLSVSVVTFDLDERKAIRKAIISMRKKREKSHDAKN